MIALMLALFACSQPIAMAPAGHPDDAAPSASSASLYDVPLALVDAHGTTGDLSFGRGHPTLIAMVYTSCAQACPMLIGKLQTLDAQLPTAARDDVRFVLVSLDPAHDTPEALGALAVAHRFDARWTLLRGDEDTTDQVAALLGVRHRARADGSVDHSVAIALLDRDGVPVARIDGLSQPTDTVADAIVAMSAPLHD